MSYCNGDCKSLNGRYHKCDKYNQKLAYMKQSGSIAFSVHEQCRECQLENWNKKLEEKIKKAKSELEDMLNGESSSSDYREGIIEVLNILDWCS